MFMNEPGKRRYAFEMFLELEAGYLTPVAVGLGLSQDWLSFEVLLEQNTVTYMCITLLTTLRVGYPNFN